MSTTELHIKELKTALDILEKVASVPQDVKKQKIIGATIDILSIELYDALYHQKIQSIMDQDDN